MRFKPKNALECPDVKRRTPNVLLALCKFDGSIVERVGWRPIDPSSPNEGYYAHTEIHHMGSLYLNIYECFPPIPEVKFPRYYRENSVADDLMADDNKFL